MLELFLFGANGQLITRVLLFIIVVDLDDIVWPSSQHQMIALAFWLQNHLCTEDRSSLAGKRDRMNRAGAQPGSASRAKAKQFDTKTKSELLWRWKCRMARVAPWLLLFFVSCCASQLGKCGFYGSCDCESFLPSEGMQPWFSSCSLSSIAIAKGISKIGP